jgi:fermentation-respiration switch protein FrsA (DUF1100 family)
MNSEEATSRDRNFYPALLRAHRRFLSLRTLYIFCFVLVVACGAGFFGLRWFEKAATFHPVRYAPGPSWNMPQGCEDVWFQTADGLRLHGWFINSRADKAAGTVIYFHGNGGNLSHVGWIGARLAASGFDVLLFDYRGYGRSAGDVADERAIYIDADAAYDYVVRERGAKPEKLALYGQSLGTTAVVDLASRLKVGAIILESGLSSASDMASAMLPWMPRWLHALGRNRFESVRKLGNVYCPVMVTHGDPDNTISTEQGRALYAAAHDPKRLMIIEGAGHNVAGFGGYGYIDKVSAFIRESLTTDKSE